MADFESGFHRLKKGGEDAFLAKHLAAFYGVRPLDVNAALKGMFWFYNCENGRTKKHSIVHSPSDVAYDFELDADLIYSAFRQTYGIDLSCTDMHWWKFRALMNSLPESTQFIKVIGYRVADLRGMSDKQREYYERMKELYAMPPEIGGRRIYAKCVTKEEAEKAFIERLQRHE